MNTFFISWLLATFVQFGLGLKCKQWIGWMIPALFLAFAIYAWVDLVRVGIRVSVLIVLCLPCVWLPSVFYLAHFYGKWMAQKFRK